MLNYDASNTTSSRHELSENKKLPKESTSQRFSDDDYLGSADEDSIDFSIKEMESTESFQSSVAKSTARSKHSLVTQSPIRNRNQVFKNFLYSKSILNNVKTSFPSQTQFSDVGSEKSRRSKQTESILTSDIKFDGHSINNNNNSETSVYNSKYGQAVGNDYDDGRNRKTERLKTLQRHPMFKDFSMNSKIELKKRSNVETNIESSIENMSSSDDVLTRKDEPKSKYKTNDAGNLKSLPKKFDKPFVRKYKFSNRINRLAMAKEKTEVEPIKLPVKVREEALHYVATERIMQLAEPIKRESIGKVITLPIPVKKEALSYIPTKRIQELAAPRWSVGYGTSREEEEASDENNIFEKTQNLDNVSQASGQKTLGPTPEASLSEVGSLSQLKTPPKRADQSLQQETLEPETQNEQSDQKNVDEQAKASLASLVTSQGLNVRSDQKLVDKNPRDSQRNSITSQRSNSRSDRKPQSVSKSKKSNRFSSGSTSTSSNKKTPNKNQMPLGPKSITLQRVHIASQNRRPVIKPPKIIYQSGYGAALSQYVPPWPIRITAQTVRDCVRPYRQSGPVDPISAPLDLTSLEGRRRSTHSIQKDPWPDSAEEEQDLIRYPADNISWLEGRRSTQSINSTLLPHPDLISLSSDSTSSSPRRSTVKPVRKTSRSDRKGPRGSCNSAESICRTSLTDRSRKSSDRKSSQTKRDRKRSQSDRTRRESDTKVSPPGHTTSQANRSSTKPVRNASRAYRARKESDIIASRPDTTSSQASRSLSQAPTKTSRSCHRRREDPKASLSDYTSSQPSRSLSQAPTKNSRSVRTKRDPDPKVLPPDHTSLQPSQSLSQHARKTSQSDRTTRQCDPKVSPPNHRTLQVRRSSTQRADPTAKEPDRRPSDSRRRTSESTRSTSDVDGRTSKSKEKTSQPNRRGALDDPPDREQSSIISQNDGRSSQVHRGSAENDRMALKSDPITLRSPSPSDLNARVPENVPDSLRMNLQLKRPQRSKNVKPLKRDIDSIINPHKCKPKTDVPPDIDCKDIHIHCDNCTFKRVPGGQDQNQNCTMKAQIEGDVNLVMSKATAGTIFKAFYSSNNGCNSRKSLVSNMLQDQQSMVTDTAISIDNESIHEPVRDTEARETIEANSAENESTPSEENPVEKDANNEDAQIPRNEASEARRNYGAENQFIFKDFRPKLRCRRNPEVMNINVAGQGVFKNNERTEIIQDGEDVRRRGERNSPIMEPTSHEEYESFKNTGNGNELSNARPQTECRRPNNTRMRLDKDSQVACNVCSQKDNGSQTTYQEMEKSERIQGDDGKRRSSDTIESTCKCKEINLEKYIRLRPACNTSYLRSINGQNVSISQPVPEVSQNGDSSDDEFEVTEVTAQNDTKLDFDANNRNVSSRQPAPEIAQNCDSSDDELETPELTGEKDVKLDLGTNSRNASITQPSPEMEENDDDKTLTGDRTDDERDTTEPTAGENRAPFIYPSNCMKSNYVRYIRIAKNHSRRIRTSNSMPEIARNIGGNSNENILVIPEPTRDECESSINNGNNMVSNNIQPQAECETSNLIRNIQMNLDSYSNLNNSSDARRATINQPICENSSVEMNNVEVNTSTSTMDEQCENKPVRRIRTKSRDRLRCQQCFEAFHLRILQANSFKRRI